MWIKDETLLLFQEKSKDNTKTPSVGLYTYPVLQAADILLYKSVPLSLSQLL